MNKSGPTASDQPRVRLVRCPSCSGNSVYSPINPFRPFCSQRCKNVDLGAWASESFRVPHEQQAEDEVIVPPTFT